MSCRPQHLCTMRSGTFTSKLQPRAFVRVNHAHQSTALRQHVHKLAAYKITLKTPGGKEITFECDDSTFILDAAEEAGLDLPYSCRSGSCSTCAGKIKVGAVDQADQSFLDDEQISQGYAMLCVSYPTSDLEIETHQEESLFD